MTVGPVYEDPRGRIGRDGSREHLFTVVSGDFVRNYRFQDAEAAEAAREAAIAALEEGSR